MDFYTIFKFLHVVAAMAWVGGGVTLFAMVIFAERAKDDAEMMRLLGTVGMMGNRWFLPASLLTLVFGIITTTLGGLWAELWVVLGLVGLAASFLTGHFVLRVKAMAAGKFMAEGNLSQAAGIGRKLICVAKFDYVMLFLIVADMVLRPEWTDFLTLGLFVAVLAVSAWFFLGVGAKSAEAQLA